MVEIEAAPRIIAQTGADALYQQLCAGLLTPDEYHTAVALVEPLIEDGPRCLYCAQSAVVGKTCAEHTPIASVMQAARDARPIIDLSRYSTPDALITAVMTTLEKIGREKPAGRFAERAEQAPGMNAVVMIAREYVKLENGLDLR